MAAPSRRADPSLEDRLLAEPYRFGFFQAVRLLHALERGRAPVGYDGPPEREVVRFSSEISLSFPASEIFELSEGRHDGPLEMTIRCLGAAGPQSALPLHYAELMLERIRRKRDDTLASFLDLFVNHRAASFFFRSWEKYRLYTRTTVDLEDDLSVYLFCLFGLGTRGLRRRLAVSDGSLLFYAGLFAQRPHSATALEALLSDYFHGIAVRLVQFVGQWIELEAASLTQIGQASMNGTLGLNAVVGTRVWVTQARFRVRLGPLKYGRFCDFLPCGTASLPMLELTRFFAGQEYDFDFQLVLEAPEVPACQLGSVGPEATRLGWSSWLKSREFRNDANDTILDSEALRSYFATSRGEP